MTQRHTFTIGSDLSCDLVLADETVAPQHAQLEVSPSGTLILSDCGQAPATKVVHRGETRVVRRAVLTLEDSILLGDLEMPVTELIGALDLGNCLAAQVPASAEPRGDVTGIAGDAPVILPCAHCGGTTDSLKRHRLYRSIVFLGIAWWAQMADYTACASCMRRILIRRTLVNLPGANLAWPIVAAVHGWHFVASYQHGHSRRVQELLP